MTIARRWDGVGRLRLVHLAAKWVAGRRYWIAPLLPLVWPAFQVFRLAVGWREESYRPAEVQNGLMAFPLAVLAIGLGVRVIAGEVDRRTLEIAYTVPGGAHRVWLAKLVAAAGILAVSEGLLAAAAFALFTEFPPGALYGAFQAAVFHLVLAMFLAALFRSEAAGALVSAGMLALGLMMFELRISAFWNPGVMETADAANVLAWTVQNRIGYALAIAAIVALAFGRADRREAMLGA